MHECLAKVFVTRGCCRGAAALVACLHLQPSCHSVDVHDHECTKNNAIRCMFVCERVSQRVGPMVWEEPIGACCTATSHSAAVLSAQQVITSHHHCSTRVEMDSTACQICWQAYDRQHKRPRTLPSGHTTCSGCMRE